MTDGMEAHGHGLLVFHFDMDGKFWQKQKLGGLIHENYRQVNMGIMKFFYISDIHQSFMVFENHKPL